MTDEERVVLWYNDIHIDAKGTVHRVSQMNNRHLINTLKYFYWLDNAPLAFELKRRLVLGNL